MAGKILIAADLGDALRPVLDHGLGFADALGATPAVLHVDPHPPLFIEGLHSVEPDELAAMQRAYRERALEQLRLGVRALGRDARGVEVLVRDGRPDECVCEVATSLHAEAIVVGAEQHGALEHLVVGRTALRVIRSAPCPVLTARAGGPFEGIRRVLLASDLSHDRLGDAEAWAARFASQLDAYVSVVHVSSVGSGFGEPYALPSRQLDLLRSRVSERLEAVSARVAGAAAGRGRVDRHLLFEDDPARALAAFAEKAHADLVVMGTHARRGLPRAFLGSVAEGVMRHAKTSFLTVHERDAG